MARSWYIFNGSISSNAQYDASNYRIISGANKPACVNGVQICAIYAYHPVTNTSNNPIAPLSKNIQQYITDGIATQVSQPQIPTNSKRFLYLR